MPMMYVSVKLHVLILLLQLYVCFKHLNNSFSLFKIHYSVLVIHCSVSQSIWTIPIGSDRVLVVSLIVGQQNFYLEEVNLLSIVCHLYQLRSAQLVTGFFCLNLSALHKCFLSTTMTVTWHIWESSHEPFRLRRWTYSYNCFQTLQWFK